MFNVTVDILFIVNNFVVLVLLNSLEVQKASLLYINSSNSAENYHLNDFLKTIKLDLHVRCTWRRGGGGGGGQGKFYPLTPQSPEVTCTQVNM